MEHCWEPLALIDFVMFVWLVHACANLCPEFQQRYVQSSPIGEDCSLFFVSWACRFRLLPHAQHKKQEWHSSESQTFTTRHQTYQTSCTEVVSLLHFSPVMSLCITLFISLFFHSILPSLLSSSLIFSLCLAEIAGGVFRVLVAFCFAPCYSVFRLAKKDLSAVEASFTELGICQQQHPCRTPCQTFDIT